MVWFPVPKVYPPRSRLKTSDPILLWVNSVNLMPHFSDTMLVTISARFVNPSCSIFPFIATHMFSFTLQSKFQVWKSCLLTTSSPLLILQEAMIAVVYKPAWFYSCEIPYPRVHELSFPLPSLIFQAYLRISASFNSLCSYFFVPWSSLHYVSDAIEGETVAAMLGWF